MKRHIFYNKCNSGTERCYSISCVESDDLLLPCFFQGKSFCPYFKSQFLCSLLLWAPTSWSYTNVPQPYSLSNFSHSHKLHVKRQQSSQFKLGLYRGTPPPPIYFHVVSCGLSARPTATKHSSFNFVIFARLGDLFHTNTVRSGEFLLLLWVISVHHLHSTAVTCFGILHAHSITYNLLLSTYAL